MSFQQPRNLLRQTARFPIFVDGNMMRCSGGQKIPILLAVDLVLEVDARAIGHCCSCGYLQQVVVVGGFDVLAMSVNNGEKQRLAFELSVAHAFLSQVIGSTDLEPREVVGIVDHSHLVGLAVSNAELAGRFGHGGFD
jgi:hypothetical protein